MRTIEDMVRAEVMVCLSGMVSTLAGGDYSHGADALGELMDQALELASPLLDYESAALEAGWHTADDGTWDHDSDDEDRGTYETAQELCEGEEIEPHEREVFEHWAVSEWLADQLEAEGEKVARDFQGLNVWARTTSGQMISMDWVMERIHAKAVARYEAATIINDVA
jgi:hypothetical protein